MASTLGFFREETPEDARVAEMEGSDDRSARTEDRGTFREGVRRQEGLRKTGGGGRK